MSRRRRIFISDASKLDKYGCWVCATTASAVNPEYAEQIFQPFKRLHGQAKFEGTGIGLAICARWWSVTMGRIGSESERQGRGISGLRYHASCNVWS